MEKSDPKSKKTRVMIVEDHPIVSHALAMLLDNQSDLCACGGADSIRSALSAFKGDHDSHKDADNELEKQQKKLRKLQELFYIDGRRSLLICLQGMDTGGKDGTINHILGAMNAQGCRVVGFRQPSVEESKHDFLWRIHQVVPAKARVTIFNRSHYEDVLIVRVHNLVPETVWSRRFDQINAFENELAQSDTIILKFYLHISKERATQSLQGAARRSGEAMENK